MILLLFISIILPVFLGTFIYLKDKESLPNKLFALWMFVSVVSNISNFLQSIAKTAEEATMANPAIMGFSFLFTAILILMISSLYYPAFIKTKKCIFPYLIFAAIFFTLPFIDYCFGANLITNGVAAKGSNYVTLIGPYRFVILVYHNISLIVVLTLLALGYRRGKTAEKRQIVLILLAYVITFITMSVAHSITDQLIKRLLVDCASLILTLSFTYFIVKHKLFSPLKAALELAVRSMRDGLIVFDNDGNILRMNYSAQKYFNISKDFLNKNISEVFAGYPGFNEGLKDDEAEFDYMLPNYSGRSQGDFKGNLQNPEKEKSRTVNVTKAKILDENGEICGSLIIVKDVTERKMFEDKIKEANLFLENLFDTCPDGIIVRDLKGKIEKVNEAAAKIFGFEKEELIGNIHDAFRVNDNNSSQRKKEFSEKLNKNGKITNFESIARRKNGEIFPIELSSSFLKDKFDNSIGAVTIFRDISDRKKLEEEVRGKKEFLEKIIETSADGIIITHKGGVITHANESIKRLSEYYGEELIGKHISIFKAEEKEVSEEFLNKLFENGHISSEDVLKTKNGNCISIEWSISLLKDENGDRTGSMSVIRDIRKRKELESQVMQSSKLAAIGELAAGVAHELNNPLAGILGYAQLINDKIEKKGIENIKQEDIQKIAGYHKQIEKESHRCKTIVHNLLKFSRSSKMEFGPVDINSVIEETTAFTKHQLDINKIQLVKELDENLPIISANSSQLQQVFTNMIINAQKAMPGGGTIKVCSRHVNGSNGNGEMVEVEFSDTGCGIHPDHLGKIFDPFFTTRKIGEGTGLGLSVSHGIIKDHHGEIKVKSTLNQGTAFTILLPANNNCNTKPAEKTAA